MCKLCVSQHLGVCKPAPPPPEDSDSEDDEEEDARGEVAGAEMEAEDVSHYSDDDDPQSIASPSRRSRGRVVESDDESGHEGAAHDPNYTQSQLPRAGTATGQSSYGQVPDPDEESEDEDMAMAVAVAMAYVDEEMGCIEESEVESDEESGEESGEESNEDSDKESDEEMEVDEEVVEEAVEEEDDEEEEEYDSDSDMEDDD